MSQIADHAVVCGDVESEPAAEAEAAFERPAQRVGEQLVDLAEGQGLGQEVAEVAIEDARDSARCSELFEAVRRRRNGDVIQLPCPVCDEIRDGPSDRRVGKHCVDRSVWKTVAVSSGDAFCQSCEHGLEGHGFASAGLGAEADEVHSGAETVEFGGLSQSFFLCRGGDPDS